MGGEPLLVYNRIDHNKRLTRSMLIAFAAAMMPSVSAAAVLAVPFIAFFGGIVAFAIYGQELAARIEALEPTGTSGASGLTDLPRPLLNIIAAIVGLALLAALAAIVLVASMLIARYGARVLLRLARARPVTRDQEPNLMRVVENLCIGAGLPMPTVHVIEAQAPNAFATGSSPDRASLAVTRGLLQLLDRRELEGVIAHELSHIGNHDIKLTTTLSGIVGTLSFPFRIFTAPIRAAFRSSEALGFTATAVGFAVLMWYVLGVREGLNALGEERVAGNIPTFIHWWGIHAMLAPFYAVAIAPVLALLIRQAVSQQREFLADADAALLTRDPMGLASALAKIGRAHGEKLSVGEGTAHLYIVDPVDQTNSLLHRVFPSHPPLERRIDLLRRMSPN